MNHTSVIKTWNQLYTEGTYFGTIKYDKVTANMALHCEYKMKFKTLEK